MSGCRQRLVRTPPQPPTQTEGSHSRCMAGDTDGSKCQQVEEERTSMTHRILDGRQQGGQPGWTEVSCPPAVSTGNFKDKSLRPKQEKPSCLQRPRIGEREQEEEEAGGGGRAQAMNSCLGHLTGICWR